MLVSITCALAFALAASSTTSESQLFVAGFSSPPSRTPTCAAATARIASKAAATRPCAGYANGCAVRTVVRADSSSPSAARRDVRSFMSVSMTPRDCRDGTKLYASVAASLEYSDHQAGDNDAKKADQLSKLKSTIVRMGMISYVASMCIALPVTLFPLYALHRLKLISRVRKERLSLRTGSFCSRWLMRIFPFARTRVISSEGGGNADEQKDPQPAIWVCNHISLLDVFVVLASDKKMRGPNRRPVKILYWKGLESNPISQLLFTMCGFIPVDMADNGNGNANQYDPKSFKKMLRSVKNAISDGFDIGLLPEGQPNPAPERGLQPVFSGAYTLAKLSRRPIRMFALYGLDKLWNADENIGMACTARDTSLRVYPGAQTYGNAEEFVSTFEAVVGHFGATGKDLPEKELGMWLNGSMWETELSRRAADAFKPEKEDVGPEVGPTAKLSIGTGNAGS